MNRAAMVYAPYVRYWCSDSLDFFALVERARARGFDGVEAVEEVEGERAGDLVAVDEVLFLGAMVGKGDGDHITCIHTYTHHI